MSISDSISDMSVTSDTGRSYKVYGNDNEIWQEINMLNLVHFIKQSIETGLTLQEVTQYIMSHSSGKEIDESCRFVVPDLYEFHLKKSLNPKSGCILCWKKLHDFMFFKRNNTNFDYMQFSGQS